MMKVSWIGGTYYKKLLNFVHRKCNKENQKKKNSQNDKIFLRYNGFAQLKEQQKEIALEKTQMQLY